jgi:hypothetical protein
MSRTGVEEKPAWRAVPRAVRRAVEDALGAPVARAARIWGGYGPTPTFRLRLADGRGAFLKGASPESSEFIRKALAREQRVYREIGHLIEPWIPRFYGAVEHDGWSALLLEDLGPKSAPPWTPALARAVTRAYADFHRATLGVALPDWLPSNGATTESRMWSWAEDEVGREPLALLAGDRAPDARRWLTEALPALAAASRSVLELDGPTALLHRDTRSDNLRWCDRRLYIFDWPWGAAGPIEYDVVPFAQSVTVEGGPEPETVVGWYAERGEVRPEALDAATAATAGFFACEAPKPEIPGLPRLRPFQRQQVKVTLAWAARRLRLPEPDWLEVVPN